jgi:hypothetical protein
MPQGRGTKKSTAKRKAKPKTPKEAKAQEPFGVLLVVTENGYQATPTGGMAPMAIPTHLRAGANAIEAELTKAGG